MTERAERGAREKGRYDLGRRLEGAVCGALCLWTAGAWPVSQAENKPVDGRPRRSPPHSDPLPQPAPWPLPLTVGVRLGRHRLLFPGPSPGRGASAFSPCSMMLAHWVWVLTFPPRAGGMRVSYKCAHAGGCSQGSVCSESRDDGQALAGWEATSVSDSWLHSSPLEKRLIFTEGPCAGTEMHDVSVTHFL